MSKGSVEKKHISMYPDDWAVVEKVSQEMRLGNTSAAIRYIINQYKKQAPATNQPPAATPPQATK